jgi:putative DNA primase/helicase
MQYTQAAKARDIAPGRWRSILQAAGIDEGFLHKKEGPCPICGGKSRFFFSDKDSRGTWYCRYCGSGDGFVLMQLYLQLDFAGAARWIENWFGGQPVAVRKSTPPLPVNDDELTPEEIIRRKAKHKNLWESSRPVIQGDPVWNYLHRRVPGFKPELISKMIRFNPSQPYYEEVNGKMEKTGMHPAMISMILAPDGTCADVHRTYLTMAGDKADVREVKKTLASIRVKGGAIRLVKPTGNVLAVGEGIETAYAVMMFKQLPCWATVNTAGMKNFEVPQGIEYLHIFADNDRPNKLKVRAGFEAAKALQEKAIAKGVTVKMHAPTKVGTDMLDLLLGMEAAKKLKAA